MIDAGWIASRESRPQWIPSAYRRSAPHALDDVYFDGVVGMPMIAQGQDFLRSKRG